MISIMHNPRVSEQAVRDATGRGRQEWFAALDAWGGAAREHKEIVAWLLGEHAVSSWWAQTLTVDYEQARGLRPPGGGRNGTFTISVSRSVGAPISRLFEAVTDAALRERWLPGGDLRVRTTRPHRSARFDAPDGATRVTADFADKGGGHSRIAVSHERLPDADTAAAAKAYWRERLTALKIMLEG
jgi:uncharacterized protein YndB with AHSA1/START domain